MTNKNIIIANWKMNQSFDDVEPWINDFDAAIARAKKLPDIVVCPPSILIDYFDEILLGQELDYLTAQGENIEELSEAELEELTSQNRIINVGGQDCGAETKGAFTGDISALNLKDAGCKYVILGHSERRQYQKETDNKVQSKVSQALENSLTPVLCIGESLKLREDKKYFDHIKKQIQKSIPKKVEAEDFIIAYEPIWAIGTGKVPTIKEITEVVDFIKEEVEKNIDLKIKNLRILYGGSTNAKNAQEIMGIKNVSGMLVGGASLKPDEFAKMALSC